ncbi:Bacterial Ig-like domain (group 3) [Neisseria subflava]|uniref:Bacterial Ig-like domain (Group 3) n=1 Tax=Neisseria subflava TaxID=28449 RepID=A0A9X9SME4_NEISU|nr:Bacterial Ig-like domain (group 3) [Neisseria subflava]
MTLTKNADGSWTSDKPETVPSVEAGKDSTTIPQDKVKDGSEVTAQAKDPSGNESTPVKANAGNNAATPDTTAPSAPEVTPSTTDGSVTVKVPGDAQVGDTVEVTVTPEGSDTPEKVTLTKNADGSWTSDKPETVPSVEAGKDSTTIPQDKVKDGSEVSAKAKDPAGNESAESKGNAGNNADHTAPSAPEVTPSSTDGSVKVKVPSDAEAGDTVEVTVTPEGSDTPEKVTLTKQPDGSWTSDKPETVPGVEAGKDSTTIPEDKVKDGSEVSAKAKDPAGNESAESKGNAGNNADHTAPSAPEVTPSSTDGSVKVKVPSDAEAGDTVEVTVTPEGSDTPEKVTLTKQPDGSWTSDKPETVPNVEAGKDSTTIPEDKVKDGSEVTAQAKDPAGNESTPVKANAGNNADTTAPSAPEVTPSTTDGSVTVKVPSDAQTGDTVEVTVTPEGSDTPEKVTLTKNADGSWTSDKPETVPSIEAGKDSTTIPQDKVKDGSDVTAQAKDPSGNDSVPVTAQAGENADITAPGKPTIDAKINGTVEITPPADEDTKSVEVNYIDEEGNPQKVTIIKDANEGWIPSEPFDLLTNPDVILPDPETGKITLPADKVKDGSLVKASATDNVGNKGEEATENAVSNPDTRIPDTPVITPFKDGSATVQVPNNAEAGDILKINLVNGSMDTITTVTLIKNADGSWTSDNPEIAPNIEAGKDITTLPADKLKDAAAVGAQVKTPSGNEGPEPLGYILKDITAPAQPTVTAKDNGSVEVTPPADEDTKSVEVSYTDEAGTPKTATITKGADGVWTSNNPDVAVESATGKATIPADKVQDGSPVKAKATDNAGNTGKEGTANAGNNPDTTAPSAPEVTPSTEDGSVTVKVPSDAQTGDTVEVTVTPEGSDTPEKVTLTKNANGSWTSDKPETVPSIDAGKDSTTIPEDKVKDGSKVTAQAKDPAGNESTPTTVTAGNDKPSAPTVTASTEDGSVTVAVPDDAKEGDVLNIAVEGENDNAPTSVSLTKQSDGSWTSSNPNIVPNIEVGKNSTTIPQDNIKDGSDINAMISRGNVISDQATAQAGSDKVVKLELSLAEDTGASSSDNYTKNGQVNVSGIPSGSEWEYSTDGGQTWNSGSGNSFTLPNNTKVGGIAYSLQARVKGNAASTSDTLNMTLDQKAGEFHAIIDGDMNLIGTAEKNSTISINNRSGKANANGEFEFATGIASGTTAKKVHYTVVETDLAGNSVSKDVAYTYYRRYAGGTKDTYGNENDVILIGTKGGTGDLGALIKSSLTTGDGDDSVYATGVQYGSNTLDMGNGNDFASFKNIGGTINMGAGNDILEGRNTDNPFFYLSQHARVDMGTGDDIVRTANTLNTRASIDGGDGFDTLQFINNNGKAFSSTLTMISHFEKIDITGTLNNSVTISASDVERNHSAKATVDASGKSHNNVLIVDGDAGDKVTLSGISKAASSKVTYEGNTYNVYNTGSNELWVDSDITIA